MTVSRRRRPTAVLMDVGLTLIHPDGAVLLEALCDELPETDRAPEDLVAALQLAAEARHLRWPRGSGDDRVAATWAMLLDLPAAPARRAWRRAIARDDLYSLLDPDAPALLDGVRRRGLKLAAVSNSDGTLDEELSRFGLRDAFDVVVDSTLVGVEKPHPGIYAAATRALGVPAHACWLLGDGLVNDVIGAQGAGIGTGVLYDRFGVYAHLTGIARVRRLRDVLALLDEAHAVTNRKDRHAA